MYEQQDIAIIGMSGVFPEADDLAQFYTNLCRGVDSVRPMPERRRRSNGFDAAKDYILCGYLDRIDEFDHQFFNISKREAEQMDPQQRFALELTCAAIENAGYGLRQLRASKTSVSLSALQNSYSDLLEPYGDGPALIGNLTASVAGKVSYYLNLHGPAMMIDTSCSSSLVAVHDACSKLLLGEADYAIAGGINLYVFFPEQSEFSDPLGIAAPDGKSKTFDARADGTGIGEGAGVVLLKPLRRALEDRDHIHAVIKASGVNQDGGRSNGVAAPSPVAQTELIVETWKKAGVHPDTLTYIEAHGTGTHLGDPIEIQALSDAFRQFTPRRQFCAISSVKTNIGHLGFAAGISGLIKSVLALKHRQQFPSLHFNEPNPHIDFATAPLYVNTELRGWETGPAPRRAAVSSFGISGTNAHVLMEETPARRNGGGDGAAAAGEGTYLVTLSAKTIATLREYAGRVTRFLDENDAALADVSFVLNAGRDDYAYRFGCVVGNRGQLSEILSRIAEGAGELPENSADRAASRVIFLCSGDLKVRSEIVDNLCRQFAVFGKAWEECRRLPGGREVRAGAEIFAFQYALARLWRSFGVASSHILGTGAGNFVVAVETGRMQLEEAVAKASAFAETTSPFKFDKFKNALDKILEEESPIFLELGREGILSRSVRDIGDAHHHVSVMASYGDTGGRADVLGVLAKLYTVGVAIDWNKFYDGQQPHRIELPTYPFEKTSCWVGTPRLEGARRNVAESIKVEPATAVPPAALTDELATGTERTLAAVWADILKVDTLQRDDDYFDLGGNSLSGTQLITRIEKQLGVKIEFEAIYDYPTLTQLAGHIDQLRATAAPEIASAAEATTAPMPRVSRAGPLALSFAQERLFHLYQLEPDSPFYNMPGAIRLKGRLRFASLEQSLNEILLRHEALRTTYMIRDGEPSQVVVAASSFRFTLTVVDLTSHGAAEREAEALRLVSAETMRPFDLLRRIPLRATLLRLSDEEHILLLTLHHICADGWSIGIFFEELAELYAALVNEDAPRLPPLPVQYVDYAYWQRGWLRGQVWEEQLAYWRRQLHGAPPLIALPCDHPRPPVQSFRGALKHFALPAGLAESLKAFGRQEGATLFMTLLAAYNTLLSRYTGQEDICVGSPIANRPRLEIEKLIGFFANTLVLRTDLSGGPSFRQLVRRVRDTTLGAYAHQDVPFEKLVQVLAPQRSMAYTPLFQVAFALQNAPRRELELPGLTLSYLETESVSAKFDLMLSLTEDKHGLAGILEYNTDLFDATTVERLLGSFRTLLESVAADPDQPLQVIPLLSEAEQHELLVMWNDRAEQDAYDLN